MTHENLMNVEVFIAGPKRAGKTTLATNIAAELKAKQISAVVLDVDAIRAEIFGPLTQLPDTDDSMRYHRWALLALQVGARVVVEAGGVPILVAGFSRTTDFQQAKQLTIKHGTRLKYLVVEPPTLEEAARRARHMPSHDHSDMRDFADPRVQKSFGDSVERNTLAYNNVNDACLLRIAQATPDEMAIAALNFVLA